MMTSTTSAIVQKNTFLARHLLATPIPNQDILNHMTMTSNKMITNMTGDTNNEKTIFPITAAGLLAKADAAVNVAKEEKAVQSTAVVLFFRHRASTATSTRIRSVFDTTEFD